MSDYEVVKIVKALGNSGHVLVPRRLIGKRMLIMQVKEKELPVSS